MLDHIGCFTVRSHYVMKCSFEGSVVFCSGFGDLGISLKFL